MKADRLDTHEWAFPGGSGIVTTTTGGAREAPDFCVSGGSEDGRQELAAEVLKLAGLKCWRTDPPPVDEWVIVWCRENGEESWTPAIQLVEMPEHSYPNPDGTSDCANGCGCWMGPLFRSGGPKDLDPFGRCPKAPYSGAVWHFTYEMTPDPLIEVLAWMPGPERPAFLSDQEP